MTIPEIHNIMNFMSDKEQGAYFTTDEIDMSLDMAQLRELQKYFADDRSIQNGNVQLMYRQMQHIDDAIRQFKHGMTGTIAVNTGQIDLSTAPSSVLYITGGMFKPTAPTGQTKEILVSTYQEYLARRHSSVFKDLPIAYTRANIMYIYAKEPGATEVEVILRPIKPNFGTNVTLNWNDSKTIDIIYVALQILGINASDEALMQFAASKSNPQI